MWTRLRRLPSELPVYVTAICSGFVFMFSQLNDLRREYFPREDIFVASFSSEYGLFAYNRGEVDIFVQGLNYVYAGRVGTLTMNGLLRVGEFKKILFDDGAMDGRNAALSELGITRVLSNGLIDSMQEKEKFDIRDTMFSLTDVSIVKLKSGDSVCIVPSIYSKSHADYQNFLNNMGANLFHADVTLSLDVRNAKTGRPMSGDSVLGWSHDDLKLIYMFSPDCSSIRDD